MKKLLAILAIVGVMTSCKDKKKDDPKTDSTETITTEPSTTAVAGVPTFSDQEVQKFVNDYTVFVTSYMDAYKTKDMSKIASMSTSAADWASRSTSIAMKLSANPDDAAKFSTYMTKLSEDMQAAMK